MQPDDTPFMKEKCTICNAPTSRVVEGGFVCTKHFREGWGRLAHMPLPGGGAVDKPASSPEEAARTCEVCGKLCKTAFGLTSHKRIHALKDRGK